VCQRRTQQRSVQPAHPFVEGETPPGVIVSTSVAVDCVDQQMSQLLSGETLIGFIAGEFRVGDQRAVSLAAGGIRFRRATMDYRLAATRPKGAAWPVGAVSDGAGFFI
jgi:hypothetical protein